MKKIVLTITVLCLFFTNIFAQNIEENGFFKITKTEIPLSQLPIENFQYSQKYIEYTPEDFETKRDLEKRSLSYKTGYAAGKAITDLAYIIAFAIMSRDYKYYEIDFSCDVIYKNRTLKLKKGIAICAQSLGQAKKNLQDVCIPYIFASENKLGNAKTISKDLKVKNLKYTAIRKSNYDEESGRDNFYVYTIPTDDSFVQYEYHAKITYELEKPKRNTEIITETSEITYTSEMQTLGVSFFDFVNNILEQARKLGYKKTPILDISNIRVYKITYTPKN